LALQALERGADPHPRDDADRRLARARRPHRFLRHRIASEPYRARTPRWTPAARRLAAALQVGRDVRAAIVLDLVDRAARVDAGEAVVTRQTVVLADQLRLVAGEGVEHVAPERQVHARLPVVHALPFEYPRDQVVHVDLEIEDEVGDERHAEELTRPLGVH